MVKKSIYQRFKKFIKRLPTLDELAARSLELKTLEIAANELGKAEIGANNGGENVDRYLTSVGRPANSREAWCAAFISYCLIWASRKDGVALKFKVSSGAKRLADNVATIGCKVAPENVKPGHIICFYRGPKRKWKTTWTRHVGIVSDVKVRPDGKVDIETIEGNVGAYPARVRKFNYTYEQWTKKLYKLASLTSQINAGTTSTAP